MRSCQSFVLIHACHHFYSKFAIKFLIPLTRWLTPISSLSIFLGLQGCHYPSCQYTWTLSQTSQRLMLSPLGTCNLFTHLQSLHITSRDLWSVLEIWPWLSLQCRYIRISIIQIFQTALALTHKHFKLQLESSHLKYVFCAVKKHQR